MYRFMKCSCLFLVALLLAPTTAQALPENFTGIVNPGVRDYDEDVVQANVVDNEAAAILAGTVPSIDLTAFKADVAAAWDNDLGGVINFDNPTLTFDPASTNDLDGDTVQRTRKIEATYGASGSGQTITLTSGDHAASGAIGSGWDNVGNDGSRGSQPISGVRNLRKDCSIDGVGCSNDFIFDISLSDPLAVVETMGVTALGKAGSTILYEVSALFNDGSTSGLVADQVAELVAEQGTDDTFFGITAPAGLWITQFSVLVGGAGLSGGFGALDDIGFITRQVPEPSSIVLLLGSLAAVSMRTRRMR